MSEKSEHVLKEALSLDASERADIASVLLSSLEASSDTDVAEAWRREVARRVAALDAGEVEPVPWEQVRDRLLARLDA